MSKKDFLATERWADDEIEELLRLAARLKRDRGAGGLEKKILAQVYLDPSLRTRASFEAAMALHGGHAITLEPGKGSWALETDPNAVMNGAAVEHLIEAARVLGRYADAVAVRSFAKESDWAVARQDRVLAAFAAHCEKPVINLESARRHPCQELADALTLRERLGETAGKTFVLAWGNHPKPLPTAVPVSAALAAARLGMEVVVARPEGYDLDPDDVGAIRDLAARHGGSVRVASELDPALSGAAAVYVKSWGALGQFGDVAAEAVAVMGGRLDADAREAGPGRCAGGLRDALPAGAPRRGAVGRGARLAALRGGRRGGEPAARAARVAACAAGRRGERHVSDARCAVRPASREGRP